MFVMSVNHLNHTDLIPMTARFRANDYFNHLLRTGWIFELNALPKHPTVETLLALRNMCDELSQIQELQLPIRGAFGTRISATDIINKIKTPSWAIAFFVVFAILQSVLNLFISIPLSFSIVLGVTIVRIVKMSTTQNENRRHLTELKDEENRLRVQIINTAQSLKDSPFLLVLPHRRVLFQPIVLPPELQRQWDEDIFKMANESIAPCFIDLSAHIPSI